MKKLLFLSFIFFGMISWIQIHAQIHSDSKVQHKEHKVEVMSASKAAVIDVTVKEKMDLKSGKDCLLSSICLSYLR